MADSEESRLKRLKHEEQMSRMFDEVMGLGNFADSSRGSVASSKSGGQTEAKGLEETSGQKLTEDSNCSKREEKIDEGLGETTVPRLASSSSDRLGETTIPCLASSSSDRLGETTIPRLASSASDRLGETTFPRLASSSSDLLGEMTFPCLASSSSDLLGEMTFPRLASSSSDLLGETTFPRLASSSSDRLGETTFPRLASSSSDRLGETTFPRLASSSSDRLGETTFPRLASSSSDQLSSFNIKRGGGEAAFDDALDGLPQFGPEEEDEDWHFALPLGSLEDVDLGKANTKTGQFGPENSTSRCNAFARKPRDNEEAEQQRQEKEGSGDSVKTYDSSQDNTPDNSRDVLNQTEETEDSQLVKTPEAAPVEESNPPICPAVNIKDEPIDEGYDAALLPQSSARQIKEELVQEELRISSVYSVGGGHTFTSPAMTTAIQGTTQTAFFIPGRGAILQAMAPLSVRPQLPVPPSIHTLTAIPQLRPPPPPVPGSVRCSGCLKVLLKGQTAFQRKGSTQLFCSTVCLTGHLPAVNKPRACFQCNREILQPRDMVTIPADNNTYLHFCGQFCLSVFRHKMKQVDKVPDKPADKRLEKKPEKPPEKPLENQLFCSICKATNKVIEHEVTHQGKLFRLCSDSCFVKWRKQRQLAMNCCEGCGLYCNSNLGSCQTLTVEKSQLYFCSPTCVDTYKQSCRKSTECANCQKALLVSSTIMERDQKGKVQLYCSSSCVEQTRPAQHGLVGTPFPCCLCKVSAIPQYHLAMVDGTIRNFCSYNCVFTFRKSDYTSELNPANGTSSLRDPSDKNVPRPGPSAGTSSVPPVPQDFSSSVPYPGHHPSHTSVPPLVPPSSATSSPTVPTQAQARSPPDQPKPAEDRLDDTPKVTCHHCSKQFNTKPLLLSRQSRISIFCSRSCSDQYKIQKSVLAVCESCQQVKLHFETVNSDQKDLFFCSDNCKLLFKQDHSCHVCTYCAGFGQKMVLSHYGGKTEKFCKPHCMSQFTVLYYGMGRCDSCRKQGYLTENLQCLGSVRNFCNMPCLLQYCYANFEPSRLTSSNGSGTPQMPSAPTQPHHSSKMNPVIADVVSLANGSAAQPSVSADAALTGALPTSNVDGKNLDHASTQTDAMRAPAPRRQMKNKSVLCRPFTTDQESMCQLPSASPETEALLDSSFHQPPTSWPRSPNPPPCSDLLTRLTGRHFLGKRESDSSCNVCSRRRRKRRRPEEEAERKKQKTICDAERKKEEEKDSVSEELTDEESETDCGTTQTSFYCKTCSEEPGLCPVPCFELYHTLLVYKTAPRLEAQATAKEDNLKMCMVPVPVPIPVFIPVPMNMYSQHTPVPMVIHVPVPVPIVVAPQTKEMKDVAVQLETPVMPQTKEVKDVAVQLETPLMPQRKEMKDVAVQLETPEMPQRKEVKVVAVQLKTPEMPQRKEVKVVAVQLETPAAEEEQQGNKSVSAEDQRGSTEGTEPVCEEEEALEAADLPQTGGSQTESPTEASETGTDPPAASFDQPPCSPLMDLEADFPPELLNMKPPVPKRGVKRPRDRSYSRKRGRRRIGTTAVLGPPANSKLNHLYGLKAWTNWVQLTQQSGGAVVKEDILQCDSAELSVALSRFVREVRRPNGETYSPDSVFYLCLGIQEYLFENGRIENIFTDQLYNQFSSEMSRMLRLWKPKLLPSGGVVPSRVEESYLWECKQLGAYSPIVLLNTLLFFCSKSFQLTTVDQHRSLTFSNLSPRSKPCSRTGKVTYLHYQRGGSEQTERLRTYQTANSGDLELMENASNPLQCPVRLYEFYLSRCPESAKKQTNTFYLQPERSIHTNSPHWYSCQPLDAVTLQSMLTRILSVREVQQEAERRRGSTDERPPSSSVTSD